MIILLFGAPGSGKGTQGRLIIEWLGELGQTIPAISTGDMLRAEIAARTPRGLETESVVSHGGLVPDDLIDAVLSTRILQPDCREGFLLDGYPRTLEQAEYLDRFLASHGLPAPVVVHLDVPDDVLVGRMISRRQCSKCGRMYNILSKRPKVTGRCDDDGVPLIVREDDREEVIRARLHAYRELTRPILSHYPSDRYFQISGDRSAAYIFEEITAILEHLMKNEPSVRPRAGGSQFQPSGKQAKWLRPPNGLPAHEFLLRTLNPHDDLIRTQHRLVREAAGNSNPIIPRRAHAVEGRDREFRFDRVARSHSDLPGFFVRVAELFPIGGEFQPFDLVEGGPRRGGERLRRGAAVSHDDGDSGHLLRIFPFELADGQRDVLRRLTPFAPGHVDDLGRIVVDREAHVGHEVEETCDLVTRAEEKWTPVFFRPS